METIKVRVSSELAQRLRPYQSELPRILEWGLRHIEREVEEKARTDLAPETMAMQMRVLAALRQAGAVGPDPEEVAQYLAEPENQRWTPIQAGGKPASEIIIDDLPPLTLVAADDDLLKAAQTEGLETENPNHHP
jgi:hypothetical protein